MKVKEDFSLAFVLHSFCGFELALPSHFKDVLPLAREATRKQQAKNLTKLFDSGNQIVFLTYCFCSHKPVKTKELGSCWSDRVRFAWRLLCNARHLAWNPHVHERMGLQER